MNRVIHIKNLRKVYPGGVEALKDISLEIFEGEVVGLMGPSGSGKSTLLHITAGLERPTEGEVYLMDQDIVEMDEDRLASFRQKYLGFVFQFYYLLEDFDVLENLTLIGQLAGVERPKEKALQILEYLRLTHRLRHRPSQLSGGEQQRVAIGRALMLEPRILLADEPTGNLDLAEGRRIFELFLKLREEKGLTLLVATHNEELKAYFDRIYRLKDGELIV
ncbi:MAG: ABC transporter ATP-binding protein [Aquificaceae bacterium]|jgi:lipoprotein-releasing system ATP-binding protein|uniref:ABC transporter ATP-binding protein n=1 Tax=Hydrogenobacter sp. Uz 6-8 TaxID=3384828 RepID=UPI000F267F00|nr:MAG: ABC transporter ATP-binding protein [Aquificota bacterium]